MYINVDGHEMLLDRGDTLGLEQAGVYEPLMTAFFQASIRAGNTVLDLGANIGYHTLKFARSVGVDGKVFAFEPEPNCFSILKENVERNGYQNVVLEQKAVSDTTGQARLYFDDDNNGAHSLSPTEGFSSVVVDTVRLDGYFADYTGPVDFIKMDIEGAEPCALNGMLSLLNRNPRLTLVTEFYPFSLKQAGTDSESYLNLLVDCGFKLYHINDSENRMKPVNTVKLMEAFNPKNLFLTNLLCVKGNNIELSGM